MTPTSTTTTSTTTTTTTTATAEHDVHTDKFHHDPSQIWDDDHIFDLPSIAGDYLGFILYNRF